LFIRLLSYFFSDYSTILLYDYTISKPFNNKLSHIQLLNSLLSDS
jgi:hypothetical protein